MKNQDKVFIMTKFKNTIVPILCILCILSVIVMIITLCNPPESEKAFIPPDFDVTALTGTPEPPQELGWSEIHQDGMNYKVGICGKIIVYGGSANIFFTNPKSNTVWLKLRVLDENNNIIGETGLIKPNEYIQSVKLNTDIQDGQKVKLKIMAYEPETYYSAGSIALNTNIEIGG